MLYNKNEKLVLREAVFISFDGMTAFEHLFFGKAHYIWSRLSISKLIINALYAPIHP